MPSLSTPFFFSLLLLFSSSSFPSATTLRFDSSPNQTKTLGGWSEIPDPDSIEEIRDLGRYSVNEYNLGLRGVAENPIVFSGVESAGRQVVSGIKYRIRVAADDARTGDRRFFDAVVVVRPWLRSRGRDLVYFSPSAD